MSSTGMHNLSCSPRLWQLSEPLITAHADNIIDHKCFSRAPQSRLAGRVRQRRINMYFALFILAAASTVFTPAFIAIRDRTNADWHVRN